MPGQGWSVPARVGSSIPTILVGFSDDSAAALAGSTGLAPGAEGPNVQRPVSGSQPPGCFGTNRGAPASAVPWVPLDPQARPLLRDRSNVRQLLLAARRLLRAAGARGADSGSSAVSTMACSVANRGAAGRSARGRGACPRHGRPLVRCGRLGLGCFVACRLLEAGLAQDRPVALFLQAQRQLAAARR